MRVNFYCLANNTKICYDYYAERIRSLRGETDTRYTYNTNAKLSQLLVKVTNGFATKYVYGHGLIGEEKQGEFKTYHFDYRGSTVAITNALGQITDTFAYDTYGKQISRTGDSFVIFGYNGRDGVVTDKNGLIYMRARYYSPEHRRFINADIIAGEISNAVTLNRYAYANGNPVSNVDPFGLSAERYDRDAAVNYAFEHYKKPNTDEYVNMASIFYMTHYFFSKMVRPSGQDCANFVSQCLETGGFEQNDEWYFYRKEHKPADWWLNPFVLYYYNGEGKLTTASYGYYFSPAWAGAYSQYKYFSNEENGYINGKPIIINSAKDIEKAISKYNIQKGDLLYWSKDGGETIHHATIISKVEEDDILYAGRTDEAFDDSAGDVMTREKESIVIVRLNDYI